MSPARMSAQAATFETPTNLWEGVWAIFGTRVRAHDRRLEAERDGARVLRLFGALDKRLAKEVKAQARTFVEGDAPGWSIDLSHVTAWDGDGLAALVYALDVSELAGKTLQLVEPSSALRLTLERSQLHHLFAIVRSEELGR